MERAIKEIISLLLKGMDVDSAKRTISKKYHLPRSPKNYEILAYADEKTKAKLLPILKKRPRRTLSGVTPIAIMIKPKGSCKHACIYCPSSTLAPKSYTGYEPAALRARRCNFNPYLQVKSRIKQYEINGHPTEKCELIIMGGTFLEQEKQYKEWFVKKAYDAFNEEESKNLEEAKLKNETAKHRVVALTIETRPDVCGHEQINEMLRYGTTRVELGVQSIYNDVLRDVKRGHEVEESIKATSLLKDSCFKVCYHIMLALPKSNPKRDLCMIKEMFSNQAFMPDMLKIYPTLVIEGTELYKRMEKGEYVPYDVETLVELLINIYKTIPPFVRIMRIMRDIPATKIKEGVKKSNLRELVENALKNENIGEIRFREVKDKAKKERLKLEKYEYKASGGKEIFLSYVGEETKALYGFIRLRFPSNPFRKEIDESTALIRELRVYGGEVLINKREEQAVQHKGIGTSLLRLAEETAKEEGYKKIIINSGVGVKQYYLKRGYKRVGPYVGKSL
jgi:elongator complex protein 3